MITSNSEILTNSTSTMSCDLGCDVNKIKYGLNEIDRMKLVGVKNAPIPIHEARRLEVLRQTGLLDSDTNDPQYDRFTSLAKRIFNVPVSVINLIDVDRAFFKSITIEFPSQLPRDDSLCSYLVGSDTGTDVMIVPNLSKDECFKDFPITKAGMRFYAGATLMIAGQRIGSLCILGPTPNFNFDLSQRMTLLDLASSLSYIIEQRRNTLMTRSSIIANLMHNLRTPLSILGMQLPLLEEDLLTKKDVTSLLQDINKSYRLLHRTVETNIVLGKLCNKLEAGNLQKEIFEMEKLMIEVKKLILDVREQVRISLNVDPIFKKFSGYIYLSFPKVLETISVASINQYMVVTDKISIEISYQLDKESSSNSNLVPCQEGYILISIEFIENKEYCSISQQTTGFECDTIVKLLGGFSDVAVVGDKKSLRLFVPCIQETKINHNERAILHEKSNVIINAVNETNFKPVNTITVSNIEETKKEKEVIVQDLIPDKKLRALIVEDSIALLKTLSRWFKSANCEVTTAENGKLGLMQLTTGQFDIVVFDFLMPVMNGLEMMQEFKKFKDNKKERNDDDAIPLMIGSSATPPTSESVLLKECGMHMFFAKPINWAKMTQILQQLRQADVNTAVQISNIIVTHQENALIGSSMSLN